MVEVLPNSSEDPESPTGSDEVRSQSNAEGNVVNNAEEHDRAAIKRRAHRKSRFGCKNCKLRRIKVLQSPRFKSEITL